MPFDIAGASMFLVLRERGYGEEVRAQGVDEMMEWMMDKEPGW
jgi:hypothetical protein